jgi:hypothetical protein
MTRVPDRLCASAVEPLCTGNMPSGRKCVQTSSVVQGGRMSAQAGTASDKTRFSCFPIADAREECCSARAAALKHDVPRSAVFPYLTFFVV